MGNIRLGVIFGGMSTENEVSVVSSKYVLMNLDKTKYDVYPIYIDKSGRWYKYEGGYENIDITKTPINIHAIENIIEYVRQLDVVFPVLHGLYGEDGTVQGLLELIKVPYVGCKVLASSIGMDKVYTKVIFEKAGIAQTKSVYIKQYKDKYAYIDEKFNEEILELNDICKKVVEKIRYPMFVKPSNSGSSVGIRKVKNIEELRDAILNAEMYDNKIIVEKGINGRELECAVLGNEDVIAGEVGEVLPADEFYSFDAKYNNADSRTIIPAKITREQKAEIQKLAIKAFKAIDGRGLSRVDFFMDNNTGKIYLNEINTMPGFTQISMYPKLIEAIGIPYNELLDRLIELAL